MRRFAPFLLIVAGLVIVVVIFTFQGNKIPDLPPQQEVKQSEPEDPATPNVARPVESADPAEPPEEMPEPPPAVVEAPTTDANWEEKLDQLLGNDQMDEDVKADKIADMILNVSEPAQKELAEHLINLTPDDGYDKAAAILKSETTPGSVSKVLLDDLFNRDHGLMLPLVLDVAKNEKHPLKADAKEMLEMFLQEDYGADWNKWTEAVDKQLKGEGQ